MKRLSIVLLLGALALVAWPTEATTPTVPAMKRAPISNDCDCDLEEGCTTILYAGQHIEVGTVSVDWWGGDIRVTYDTTSTGWSITETHLFVGCEEPAKLAPGKFPFKHENLMTQTDVYLIDPDDLDCEMDECGYLFATHAVVESANNLGELPDEVMMCVNWGGVEATFQTTVHENILDGTYKGWCVDTDHQIDIGCDLEQAAVAYSSYGSLPAGAVDYPENLDLVNWVINQDYVGKPSGCNGAYTKGDVQRAIWELIEDNPVTPPFPHDACRVSEIVADAWTNGEGFVPRCGDLIVVILIPDAEQQITIIEVDVWGCGEETAWGFGPCAFPKKWGWFFTCTLN